MEQARHGRLFILGKMAEVISGPNEKMSDYAPRFYTVQISPDKIRDLIGPGGKVIKSIVEQTGVKIDVEDSGKVNVASSDQEAAKKALQMISDICATAEVGKTYLGTVTRIAEFGAFVEIIPGTDGLLHISEIAEHRVKEVTDELNEGDQILVKVLAVEGNRIKLSRKAILKEQRAKMGDTGDAPAEGEEGVTFEGGADVADDEPNFNRVDADGNAIPEAPRPASARPDRGGRGSRPPGGRGGRPGGGGSGGRGGRGGPRR